MNSRGDCFDNAVAENFFATLKKELIHGRSWPTKAELRTEVFEDIEVFFNRRHRHSTLGFLSPNEFEKISLSQSQRIQTVAQTPAVHRSEGTPGLGPRTTRGTARGTSVIARSACGTGR